MKMKKKLAILLALVCIFGILAGCSSNASDSAGAETYNTSASDTKYTTATTNETDLVTEDSSYEEGFSATSSDSDAIDYSEKLIYTATAQIETTEFENSVQKVYDMIEFYDAYLESSYITGQNYSSKARGYQPYRYASFTIRVPSSGYKNLTQNLAVFGNVISLYESVDNITQQYYDAQSRLDTYEIEEERVLEMLEKADNVTDMIELESRLSDIRYNIESIESRLRVWQNQVDYSTVSIDIEEVAEYTEVVETQRTYGEQLVDGFKSSLKSVGRFFKNLFMSFFTAIPVLVPLAVVIVAVILIVIKVRKAHRAKRDNKTEPEE